MLIGPGDPSDFVFLVEGQGDKGPFKKKMLLMRTKTLIEFGLIWSMVMVAMVFFKTM